MKRNKIYIAVLSLGILAGGCSKGFLEKIPQGQLSTEQVSNSEGIEALLIGAYGIMNGNVNGTWGNYASAPSQWLFGEVTSDNAHKGSEQTDQPAMLLLETMDPNPANDNLTTMWQVYYEGILRCNTTLKFLINDQAGAKTVSATRAKEIEGEVKMLRGHYYFFLWRIFRNLPYIDENTSAEEAKTKPNDADIFDKIIADVKFAADNLPATKYKSEAGRMDQNIAKAYLGKLYLYQKKYDLALPLFQSVLAGKDLKSMSFLNNFNVETEDGPEALLVSKHAINPDGSADNANVGDMLSGIYAAPVSCCGFYQPTFDLVNAYQVDANGLPYLDNEYRNNPYKSDFGLNDAQKATYQLDRNLRVDPRLDYTVGRRGVPFLDYGIMAGDSWIRKVSDSGPFVGIKTMIYQSQFAAHAVAGEAYITGLDVNIMRLADVYLMAAECAVELDQLNLALNYVNDVRARAANIPVKTLGSTPVANYQVSPYPPFPDKEYARKAVRMERRLELALEGHRFFDLVRWGVAKSVLESYSTFEGTYLPFYRNLNFKTHNEYFPIPQTEIDRSGGTLKQNTGYN
ncbi:RagB/SusD family nutrient uptake outer membrane protein [Sphingobacterium rhinopitheci]|uniref:RagB/SusD family nutrient uptake outer membrane protein n=1 Tax=Sphingobacterium rhinopitheci TaxID=2781960 RepID=UPI001F51F125|nr:RagB/SusD family nutrient uptake outer membrane protein [Sphingobacterium rhinopitheci]MCI0920961.1 RagB/SusD family nutrient uptake outer membrane protein [Sphingobacterium rhinopitheci]